MGTRVHPPIGGDAAAQLMIKGRFSRITRQQETQTPELSEFSCLPAAVYDAASDPALWPTALEKISRFVPGSHVSPGNTNAG